MTTERKDLLANTQILLDLVDHSPIADEVSYVIATDEKTGTEYITFIVKKA